MGEAQFKNADDYIKSFVPMVDFLAEVLGRNSEVVLNDVRNLDHSIVAIRNNYISHRQIGDPASDLVLRMSKQGKKESKNFLTNYSGKSSKNINLRSSTFFLKFAGEVVAMLCINTSEESLNVLKNSVERVLKDYRIPTDSLSELENDNIKKTTEHDFETLTKSAKEYVHTVVNDYAQKLGITKEFMKPENKIDCVRQLHEQGYFQLKDSVEEAAKALEVSEPSIYRYIQIIKKEK